MIDPLSKVGGDLKAEEEFFELANKASFPFMRAHSPRR
jgi:hypothetical protein